MYDRYLLRAALIVLGVCVIFGFIIKTLVKERSITLVFAQFLDNGPERDTIVSLVREFEERNPGIRIRLDNRKDGNAAEPDRSSRTDLPADIIALDEGRINTFIRQGLLASLSPYVYSGAEFGQWVIPLVSFMDILFYNIEALQTAGFDRPPKTRADFLACARAVGALEKGASGAEHFGAALALSPVDPRSIRRDVFSWVWASGAVLTREGKPDFLGRPVIETLDFLGQLNREGLLSPESFDKTGALKTEEFAEGKIAMMIGSVEDIPFLRKQMGDSAFGITLIPVPANYAGKPVLGPSQWYAGISSACEYPDQAWAFLSFLAEKSPFLAAQVRAVPGSGSRPGAYIREDEFYSKAWDMYEASDVIQEFSGFPGGDELEDIIREELLPLFEGTKNAAETAAAIQKRWESLSIQ
ncbi:MAG: extracellular solute-binding protein [Treponema sp.]|nr:extracellular solute-binding protein [Treponema sp.]